MCIVFDCKSDDVLTHIIIFYHRSGEFSVAGRSVLVMDSPDDCGKYWRYSWYYVPVLFSRLHT